MKKLRRPSRGGVATADCDAIFPSSMRVAILFLLVVMQIVSNTGKNPSRIIFIANYGLIFSSIATIFFYVGILHSYSSIM